MERLLKIGNSFKPLTIYTKWSTLDVWQGSDYASDQQHHLWWSEK